MEKGEIDIMVHFLFRMEMYIGSATQDNIISFMHGADYGRPVKTKWTELLKNHISNKYQIEGSAQGWSQQVSLFSEINSIDWVQGFKLLMIELTRESKHIEDIALLEELLKANKEDPKT